MYDQREKWIFCKYLQQVGTHRILYALNLYRETDENVQSVLYDRHSSVEYNVVMTCRSFIIIDRSGRARTFGSVSSRIVSMQVCTYFKHLSFKQCKIRKKHQFRKCFFDSVTYTLIFPIFFQLLGSTQVGYNEMKYFVRV